MRFVRPRNRVTLSPHEADNRVIECAIEAGAHAIIAFNDRHFVPWIAHLGIVVSKPREYPPRLVAKS